MSPLLNLTSLQRLEGIHYQITCFAFNILMFGKLKMDRKCSLLSFADIGCSMLVMIVFLFVNVA